MSISTKRIKDHQHSYAEASSDSTQYVCPDSPESRVKGLEIRLQQLNMKVKALTMHPGPPIPEPPHRKEHHHKRKPKLGSIVYVKHWDHVLFHSSDPSLHQPSIQEAVGWLEREEPEWLQIVWNRNHIPNPLENRNQLGSGLIILKSDVEELRELVSH